MKEQYVQKKIADFLEEEGFYVIVVVKTSKAGKPDIIACNPSGVFVGIEVKLPTGRASPLQEVNIKMIHRNRGLAAICYGWDHFKSLYDSGFFSASFVLLPKEDPK